MCVCVCVFSHLSPCLACVCCFCICLLAALLALVTVLLVCVDYREGVAAVSAFACCFCMAAYLLDCMFHAFLICLLRFGLYFV